MDNIEIAIKAYGCVGDDYEDKENSLVKQLQKEQNNSTLTEQELQSILEILISGVKEIQKLYPDEQTDVCFHTNNRVESLSFEITFSDSKESVITYNEKPFFEEVAKHETLSNLILEYCHITAFGEENSRILITHEYDEGPPTGTHAMLALVNENKKWIPDYIAFLKTNTLDEEVEQRWHIKAIIEKYGWCDETMQLAIARNVSCIGQGGREQFNEFLTNGLTEYLNDQKNREHFISYILEEFENWDNVVKRVKGGSEKYYIRYIVRYARNFDGILSNDEITPIEEMLMRKWAENNSDV